MKQNHFRTHTVEGAKALNACGRYLLVEVLRSETDCTNRGVTSPIWEHNSFFVPCPEGNFTSEETYGYRKVALAVIPPAFEGCPYRFRVRGEHRMAMFGGNYVKGDSRFTDTYGAPIAVHDRCEG